jgi:hypothetical protein
MTTDADQTPFADLPAALVEEVLKQTADVGDILLKTFHEVRQDRAALRQDLIDSGYILTEGSLGYPPLPTTCGTDGSYAIERLLTADLAAAAAVAVEGLTPPSEKRYWEQPRHTSFIVPEVHHEQTSTVLRSVMLGNELLLATRAPHDLVMIDQTLTLPIIYLNQALNAAPATPQLHCSQEFMLHCSEYLNAYAILLESERSDKNYVALPKYSTRREIGREMGWASANDDRGLLTLLLKAGELTRPRSLEQPDQPWHLNREGLPGDIRKRVIAGLEHVQVFYYRPHDWLPALRVEIAEAIASNTHRLATVVHGLKHQCATSAMLEPYPLYLADRTVKALARAIPAFRQVATQRISERYEGEIGEVFFAMHGYRSDAGR